MNKPRKEIFVTRDENVISKYIVVRHLGSSTFDELLDEREIFEKSAFFMDHLALKFTPTLVAWLKL